MFVFRFKVDIVRNLTSLTIQKALLSDTGEYTLDLINEHGKSKLAITITVLGKLYMH